MEKNRRIYDVIISGCGPSGSLLGYLLASKNINTLIIEKEKFPRDKTCAGGIQHRAASILPFDISKVIEKNIHGIHFTYKGKDPFYSRHENPIIYTVKRSRFDNLLAEYAINEGCNINFGERVNNFEACNNYVIVKTSEGNYKTKILIGADGIRGTVHRKILGAEKIKKIIGYELEVKNEDKPQTAIKKIPGSKLKDYDFSDSILLDFGGVSRGYSWIFPKSDCLSVGIGAPFNMSRTVRKYFYSFLESFSLDKYCTGPIRAHGIPVRNKSTPLSSYRTINIGDAAGIGDGFTGEGLYNCLRSSFIAYENICYALKQSDFSFNGYIETINREIHQDIEASLIFTKIFYGSLKFFYKLLKSRENLFNSCCKILRGEKSYVDVLKRLKMDRFF